VVEPGPDAPLKNETSPQQQKIGLSMLGVLRVPNFRLLWIGQSISLLGDQFYLIALPWLALRLTHDPLTMGAVLAAEGVPRALFMLVGGALTDRFSARTLMLVSDLLRLVLVGLLAVLVFNGQIQVWMLFAFALIFGLVDAFAYPAWAAIVPELVSPDQLQAGNSVIQGTARLSVFIGPALAGALIALLDRQSVIIPGAPAPVPDLQGIGLAFGIDALSYLASASTLWLMKVAGQTTQSGPNESVLASIRSGLLIVWSDVVLRTLLLLVAVVNLLIVGPFMIGVPVLADTRLAGGAAAYGIIISAYGGGSLVGIVLAGVLPKPAPQRQGLVMLLLTGALGIGLILLNFASSTPTVAAIALMMGLASGYVAILFVTWVQIRTPEAMLGRMMGFMMFAAVGLVPVSNALAGALIALHPTLLFVGAGSLVILLALLASRIPAIRNMGQEQDRTAIDAAESG